VRLPTRTIARTVRPAVSAGRRLRRENGLTVIGWHRVDGARSRGLSTGVDDFRRHLDLLEELDVRVLPLETAVTRLRAGTLPERAVALTFDDGYASVLRTAWPLLKERGLPASLFVVTAALVGPLRFRWDAAETDPERYGLSTAGELVDAVGQGLDIGSHTVTHPWLPGLEPALLEHELGESRARLEDLLGRPVRSLAYPTGGWTRLVRDAAERAGYTTGITVDRGTNTARTHPLALRRSFCPESADDLRLVLDGAYTYLRPLDDWRRRRGPA
jgi:peptidoglycan/xylan/chitin deacetylase (PgdA/CDA1 family)